MSIIIELILMSIDGNNENEHCLLLVTVSLGKSCLNNVKS
jgi:hypothetical protein